MARPKSQLNDKSGAEIQENILQENPEGIDNSCPIVKAKHIPKCRRVVFLNGRDPGYPLDFHYASKTHPLHIYTLYHGREHLLPEEIIEHLESCAEAQYGYRSGINGQPEMYVKSLKYLYNFKNAQRASA